MIDKRKNAFYKITVTYNSTNGGSKDVVFFSEHQASTKRFQEFFKEYAEEHIDDLFKVYETSQRTITNEQLHQIIADGSEV